MFFSHFTLELWLPQSLNIDLAEAFILVFIEFILVLQHEELCYLQTLDLPGVAHVVEVAIGKGKKLQKYNLLSMENTFGDIVSHDNVIMIWWKMIERKVYSEKWK